MFKRLFWLTMGAGFGFGVSFWLMRWVRETTEKAAARLTPERVSADLRRAARHAASSAVAAARPRTHRLAHGTRIAPLARPTPLTGGPGPSSVRGGKSV